MRYWAVALGLVLAACGAQNEHVGESGGEAGEGIAPVAGAAPVGGSGGNVSTGGTGGAAGKGGTAGEAGKGGTSGAGGGKGGAGAGDGGLSGTGGSAGTAGATGGAGAGGDSSGAGGTAGSAGVGGSAGSGNAAGSSGTSGSAGTGGVPEEADRCQPEAEVIRDCTGDCGLANEGQETCTSACGRELQARCATFSGADVVCPTLDEWRHADYTLIADSTGLFLGTHCRDGDGNSLRLGEVTGRCVRLTTPEADGVFRVFDGPDEVASGACVIVAYGQTARAQTVSLREGDGFTWYRVETAAISVSECPFTCP
jgi:hypothetical protein